MRNSKMLWMTIGLRQSLSLLFLAVFSVPAEEPIDVVHRLIAAGRKNDGEERRALYNSLRLNSTEITVANAALALDDFRSPTWCLGSKTDGNAAVVSVITVKDDGSVDPDPCYLVHVTNDWRVLSPRTDIRAARGIVPESTMQALVRLSAWYSMHKRSLINELQQEFEVAWKGKPPPSPAELRRLQIQIFSRRDPRGYTLAETNAFLPEIIVDAALIKRLLDQGLDVEARNTSRYNQDTLLYFAVRHGATETVKLLLEKGAKVNTKSAALGKTALFQAAFDGRVEIGRILVKAGADVNALDMFSNNALREAILGKRQEFVSFLIENGANPNQRNSERQTMADIAREHGTPQIKALFK